MQEEIDNQENFDAWVETLPPGAIVIVLMKPPDANTIRPTDCPPDWYPGIVYGPSYP
jgi:hypothetical protein